MNVILADYFERRGDDSYINIIGKSICWCNKYECANIGLRKYALMTHSHNLSRWVRSYIVTRSRCIKLGGEIDSTIRRRKRTGVTSPRGREGS